MFKKINVDFSKINIDSFKGKQKNNSYHNFHEFDIKDQTQLELLIKSKIKFKINPDNINNLSRGRPSYRSMENCFKHLYYSRKR